ncbi:SMP-30/Gluconolactonase/LRE-like region [Popillia japonica]|uniref:SMP-30/Gluconolactonase/LRE-like region n=1 Tax=Popillia japonica TaxID=7064 RepID=A0AAW1M487_POPJA
MSIQIEIVTPKVTFGEGPFWDDETKSLYFVDVFDKAVCKYTPATKSFTKAQIPGVGSNVLKLWLDSMHRLFHFSILQGEARHKKLMAAVLLAELPNKKAVVMTGHSEC